MSSRALQAGWRHPFVRQPAAIFRNLLSRSHSAQVAVIPLDPVVIESFEDVTIKALVDKATTDPAKRLQLQSALPREGGDAHLSRVGFGAALQALRWLKEEAEVPPSDLSSFWDLLDRAPIDTVNCLLPGDVAETFDTMASCDQRCSELVRLLNTRCRLLARKFSAEEATLVLRAYASMGWRSTSSMRLLTRHCIHLLHDPSQAGSVTASHLRRIVGAFARLSVGWQRKDKDDLHMWKAIAAAVPSRTREMRQNHFMVILNAYGKMGFANSAIHKNVSHMFEACARQLVPRIQDSDSKNVNDFNRPQALSLIANAYAQVQAGPYAQPLIRVISAKVMTSIDIYKPQSLSLILNAHAKLEVFNPTFFESAAPVISRNIIDYDHQSLSLVAHAFAKQQLAHASLFQHIAEKSLRVMDQFTPLGLGNLAYAFGKLQVRNDGLTAALQDEVIYRGTVGKKLKEVSGLYLFKMLDLEKITQAFARLNVNDQRLFFVLFDMTRQRVRELVKKAGESPTVGQAAPDFSKAAQLAIWEKEQEVLDGHGLAVLLSSFAASRANFRTLMLWVPRQVRALDGKYTTWELAMIFNACTRLGIHHRILYKEMLSHASLRAPQMAPKAVGMLMRGMARSKMYNRHLMRQATKLVTLRLGDLDVVDVSAMLVSCAEMGYRDERFLRLLAAFVKSRNEEMTTSQLATAFASYSQTRIRHPQWFDTVLHELFRRQHELSEKSATNVAYAMMLVAVSEESFVQKHSMKDTLATSGSSAASSSSGNSPPSDVIDTLSALYPFNRHKGLLYSMLQITDKHRTNLNYPSVFQLQILDLFLRLIVPSIYEDMQHNLKELLAKARKVNVVIDDYMQNSSRLHRHISKWFHTVGLHHRNEVFLGPFMLDIVIGKKVVVEVDGPSHFYRDTNSRTVASLLKDKIIRAMGFHLKHLPYQEWQQCGTAEKKELYCATFWRDVLTAAGALNQVESDEEKVIPLADVLDMVSGWQKDLQMEPPQDPLLSPTLASNAEPSFYQQNEDSMEGDIDTWNKNNFHVDSEVATTLSVEAVLDAHHKAEKCLEDDRRSSVSARQRWQLDAVERLDDTRSPLNEFDETASVLNDLERGSSQGAPMASKDPALKAILPRREKRMARHTPAPQYDIKAAEAETDSSDEEDNTDYDRHIQKGERAAVNAE